MSTESTQTLEKFKKRKQTFDEQLQHLQLLSQHSFGLAENDIQQCHCGEVLYYTYLLEEVINSIINRNTPSQ